jgi:glycosyltransferase involved in cell wall biosynthesis
MNVRRLAKILARATPGPLRRFVKRAFALEALLRWMNTPQATRQETRQLCRAMISGFGAATAERLSAIALDRRRPPEEVAEAARALARWHRSKGEHERALHYLIMWRSAVPKARFEKAQFVLEIDTLLELGRALDADKVISDGIKQWGEIPALCFCAANAMALREDVQERERDRVRLEWISKPLVAAGFARIEIKDPSRPLALDNIAASAEPHPRSGEAKISVLMPAHNAEETLGMAIESVLAQNWTNLELVVVDDGSTDGTWAIIQAYAARDARVVALKHERNRGAYAARNTALREATGDFVTVHDSDDWSHPEQIATQAVQLLDTTFVANTTGGLRALANMRIVVKPSDAAILVEAMVSLMTRRESVLELGGWDEVRMSADNEFHDRLLLRHRQEKACILSELPLGVHLRREDSLTMEAHIGIATLRYGARREYFEASRYWQSSASNVDSLILSLPAEVRPYPVPNICKPGKPARLQYDILFVSDFSLPGDTASSNVNMLRAARALGLRCACFHWPGLDLAGKDVDVKIRKLLHEGIAGCVVAGENVQCKLVIVYYPPLLNQFPDTRPAVQADACIVVLNQAPMGRPPYNGRANGQAQYQTKKIVENARLAFQAPPVLAPVSPLIRQILKETTTYRDFTEIDWPDLIDTVGYRRLGSAQNRSRPPIVGRHSRDHEDKWPSDADTLRQAYCAGAPVEVRILGRAERLKRVLGEIPSNWTVLPFDSVDVRSFLGELDFFLQYTHEHLIEAFARGPLEAMATGVPVILPPSGREVYRHAAVYAEPAEVLNTIQTLWADRSAYDAQVERGFTHVERTCSYARFGERVRPYFGPSTS